MFSTACSKQVKRRQRTHQTIKRNLDADIYHKKQFWFLSFRAGELCVHSHIFKWNVLVTLTSARALLSPYSLAFWNIDSSTTSFLDSQKTCHEFDFHSHSCFRPLASDRSLGMAASHFVDFFYLTFFATWLGFFASFCVRICTHAKWNSKICGHCVPSVLEF